MLCKHEPNPQKNNRAETRSQNQNRESVKSKPRADASPKIDRTFAEYPPPGEHLWDLYLYVIRVLNNLDYKKLLFAIYLHTK